MKAVDLMMRYETVSFDCSDEVRKLGVELVTLAMGGLHNRDTSPDFEAYQAEVFQEIRSAWAGKSPRQDAILSGFRELHTRAGFSNRNYPASSEALLEVLLKRGALPRINLLVDIYNLVSVQTRLSLGAHDLARVAGNIHLRMTSGEEIFWPLSAPAPQKARRGAYAYIDDQDEVICFMEVRQVEKTKVGLDTTECFFIVQGNAQTAPEYLGHAAQHLAALIQRFCGGQVRLIYS